MTVHTSLGMAVHLRRVMLQGFWWPGCRVKPLGKWVRVTCLAALVAADVSWCMHQNVPETRKHPFGENTNLGLYVSAQFATGHICHTLHVWAIISHPHG